MHRTGARTPNRSEAPKVHELASLWLVAIAAYLLISAPLTVSAQQVRGRVWAVGDASSVNGALVTLLSYDNRAPMRAYTDSSGEFSFMAAAGGPYRVRVQRIGYGPVESDAFSLSGNDIVLPNMYMHRLAHLLTAVVVREPQSCGSLPKGGRAREALDLTILALQGAIATSDEGRLEVTYESFLRITDAAGAYIVSQITTGVRRGGMPFQSVAPELLEQEGYIRTVDGISRLHAPDANVVIHDSFIRSHCFRGRVERSDADSVFRVAFEPLRTREVADIAGEIILNRTTGQLSRIEFGYVGRSLTSTQKATRGVVEFSQAASGRWYVSSWRINGPVAIREAMRPRAMGRPLNGGLTSMKTEGGIVLRTRIPPH